MPVSEEINVLFVGGKKVYPSVTLEGRVGGIQQRGKLTLRAERSRIAGEQAD